MVDLEKGIIASETSSPVRSEKSNKKGGKKSDLSSQYQTSVETEDGT
jgi:hypothetical protein